MKCGVQQDFEMIMKINPRIFDGQEGDIGLEYCEKEECKTILEWDIKVNKWYCPKCYKYYEEFYNSEDK